MVKLFTRFGRGVSSRSESGARTRMHRLATLAITLVACLFAGSASAQNNWTGTTPETAAASSNADENTVYLYNVGKGQFVGKGGNWGTEGVISSVGTPFQVVATGSDSKYYLKSVVTYGYLGFMNGDRSYSTHDNGNFYVDRPNSDGSTTQYTFNTSDGYYQMVVSSNGGIYTEGDYKVVASDTSLTVVKTVAEASKANSQWILVTVKERKEAFQKAEASDSKAVPATFLMYDYDFGREDYNIGQWKTLTDGKWSNFSWSGNEELNVKPNDAISGDQTVTKEGYQYYNGCGWQTKELKPNKDEDGNKLDGNTCAQKLYGGDWTANIHGTYGEVKQTIESKAMLREGWYRVSCVGFTTVEGKAKLYASAGSATTGDGYEENNLKFITERPTTYAKASRFINENGNTYEASVMVYVKKNTDGTFDALTFGVRVEGADTDTWTCFDSFKIDYYGNPQNVLLLDEDQTSVDYINKQRLDKDAATANEKFNVYLHRTVNVGKWNSIVLPVTLTVGQVQTAFGNDVHISAFEGATHEDHPSRMYFEAITVDRGNENNIAIEAGKLYIFKPSKALPTGQKKVEAMKQSGVNLTLTDYFTFIGVPFVTSDATPFTERIEGTMGNEIYGEGSVQFAGTYVWDGGNASIPANSYVLKGNVAEDTGLWFYRTVKTKTKGFRGWLETNNKNLSFSINGVVDETTGISGLTPDNMTTAPAGIYNLNGQLVRKGTNSTEGLAKGIYVVGGRKVVVK